MSRPSSVAVLLAVAVVGAVAPGVASGSRVGGGGADSIQFRGQGKERNDVRIVQRGRSLVVTDAGAALSTRPPCRSTGTHGAVCPLRGSVAVDLRGGDDRADLSGLPRPSYPPGSFGGEGVDGGSGRDRIVGSPGTDSLRGGAGADDIRAGGGNDAVDEGVDSVGPDHIDGGAGIDEVTYIDNGFPLGNAPVTADLANPSAPTGRPGEGDHLAAVERLRGSYGDDVLRGDNGPNTLDGVSGNDTLEGRGGADVIQGAGGLDHIDAGPGDDIIDAVVGDDDIPPELLPETPVCGNGTDSVARPEPGVLIGPDCEQVGLGGYIGGFAQARPLAVGGGSATFAVPCPKGLLDTLTINRTNAIATCAGAVMVTAVDGTPLGTGSFGPTPAGRRGRRPSP